MRQWPPSREELVELLTWRRGDAWIASLFGRCRSQVTVLRNDYGLQRTGRFGNPNGWRQVNAWRRRKIRHGAHAEHQAGLFHE